jgi:monofunctional chorismate mutase
VLGEDFGELLFTHFGISGPTVLTMSRAVVHALAQIRGSCIGEINLKPALTEAELDARLSGNLRPMCGVSLKMPGRTLLPRLLIPVVVQLSGIDPEQAVHQISREDRQSLVRLLQALTVTVRRYRPLAEAVITMGGVAVQEVQPNTMASRLHPGLYFCGEVLDIDGYTGGYNLQAAFCTGAAAGEAAAATPAVAKPKGMAYNRFVVLGRHRGGIPMVQVRGVRGAITVEDNTRDAILTGSRRLLETLVRENKMAPEHMGSILFSLTDDLNAAHPAEAARQLGWAQVPLFCCQEVPVPGSLPRCIRVLVHWNTEQTQDKIVHVYLEDAVRLRPDLIRRDEP